MSPSPCPAGLVKLPGVFDGGIIAGIAEVSPASVRNIVTFSREMDARSQDFRSKAQTNAESEAIRRPIEVRLYSKHVLVRMEPRPRELSITYGRLLLTRHLRHPSWELSNGN